MNESLNEVLAIQSGHPVTDVFMDVSGVRWELLLVRFIASAILGFLIAGVFRLSHGATRSKSDHAMFTTLVLLTVLICMVTTVVGNSVARAFSLAGALAIVRFRTVVEDTRDTAFVVFAVVVGMAIGCDYWFVPAFGVPVVSSAAIILSRMQGTIWTRNDNSGFNAPKTVNIRIRSGLGIDATGLIAPSLNRSSATFHCTYAETTKQGAAIDSIYQVQLPPEVDFVKFVDELNRIEGIQSVSIQSASASSR